MKQKSENWQFFKTNRTKKSSSGDDCSGQTSQQMHFFILWPHRSRAESRDLSRKTFKVANELRNFKKIDFSDRKGASASQFFWSRTSLPLHPYYSISLCHWGNKSSTSHLKDNTLRSDRPPPAYCTLTLEIEKRAISWLLQFSRILFAEILWIGDFWALELGAGSGLTSWGHC